MKGKFGQKIIGLIVGLVLLLASATFLWYLYSTGMVPKKYLMVGAAFFAVCAIIVFLLCININKTWRSLIGCILALLIIGAQGYGIDFINVGTQTLEEITQVEPEYAEVGVFVKAEDKAQAISDLKGYNFGIMQLLDRGITDVAINNISNILGEELSVVEYETVDEAVSALIETQEVMAIIINKAFIEMLSEIEGFEDAEEKIREVGILEVEDTVKVPTGSSGGGGGSYAEGPLDIGTYVAPNPATKMPDHVISLYISGIDCYGKVSRRSRSDVNIVAMFNTVTKQILLISAPRDFYVPTPVSSGACDKLTNAGIYGAKVSKGALEMLYDAEINYYFRVNFTGFQKIVNSLGGITVNSKYSFTTKYGESFVKGENFLNGERALAFARERKSFASGDRQRGKNQMEVIKGVINKATSVAMLTNYKEILASVAASMEMDVPYEVITELINNQLSDNAQWNVSTYSVDGTGSSKKPFSQKGRSYVMVPKKATIDKAKSLIDQLITDQVPTP